MNVVIHTHIKTKTNVLSHLKKCYYHQLYFFSSWKLLLEEKWFWNPKCFLRIGSGANTTRDFTKYWGDQTVGSASGRGRWRSKLGWSWVCIRLLCTHTQLPKEPSLLLPLTTKLQAMCFGIYISLVLKIHLIRNYWIQMLG